MAQTREQGAKAFTGEEVLIQNWFGVVTNRRVVYSRGWLGEGTREDIPLQHITSVQLVITRQVFWGILFLMFGFIMAVAGIAILAILLLVLGVLLLWGSPTVIVNTAGNDRREARGLPWEQSSARAFVGALRQQLFDQPDLQRMRQPMGAEERSEPALPSRGEAIPYTTATRQASKLDGESNAERVLSTSTFGTTELRSSAISLAKFLLIWGGGAFGVLLLLSMTASLVGYKMGAVIALAVGFYMTWLAFRKSSNQISTSRRIGYGLYAALSVFAAFAFFSYDPNSRLSASTINEGAKTQKVVPEASSNSPVKVNEASSSLRVLVTPADARITLEGQGVYRKVTGSQRLGNLRPGQYKLTISKPAFETRVLEITLAERETKELAFEIRSLAAIEQAKKQQSAATEQRANTPNSTLSDPPIIAGLGWVDITMNLEKWPYNFSFQRSDFGRESERCAQKIDPDTGAEMRVCVYYYSIYATFVEAIVIGFNADKTAGWLLPYLATAPFEGNRQTESRDWTSRALRQVRRGKPLERQLGEVVFTVLGNPPTYYSLRIEPKGREKWLYNEMR